MKYSSNNGQLIRGEAILIAPGNMLFGGRMPTPSQEGRPVATTPNSDHPKVEKEHA